MCLLFGWDAQKGLSRVIWAWVALHWDLGLYGRWCYCANSDISGCQGYGVIWMASFGGFTSRCIG